jgi:tripartite-type tricarboxylate transporter receptor subunit TctC
MKNLPGLASRIEDDRDARSSSLARTLRAAPVPCTEPVMQRLLSRRAHLAWACSVVIGGLAAASSPGTASAQAATYPSKPVTVIVPFAAGGSVDSAARLVLQKLGERMKQTFVIDNVAGAAGTIGTARAVKSAPDGYTLLFAVSSPITVAPVVKPSVVKYEVAKDLLPVGVAATSPFVLIANPKLAAATPADLLRLAKESPGKLNYGTDGVGTSMHLTAELIKLRGGIDILHVPYKSGPQVLTELTSGLLDLAVMPVTLAQPFIKDGKVKALAVTSAERWPSLPDVPALGATPALRGVVVDSWYGMFAPAGTDPAIVARLARELAETVRDADLAKRMADVGLKATTVAPGAFGALIRQERDELQAVVKAAGITPE